MIQMPWAVRKSGSGYNVVKKSDGKVVGHHPSWKKAVAHLRALHANVKG